MKTRNTSALLTSLPLLATLAALASLATGCASVAVTADALERNTAFALGIDKADFTVSDRVDDGIKTSYNVKTKAGKRYACYVTGTVSITGRTVSDAICSEGGKPSGEPGTMACNALLRAAGKCK